jgi:hypothetical protein
MVDGGIGVWSASAQAFQPRLFSGFAHAEGDQTCRIETVVQGHDSFDIGLGFSCRNDFDDFCAEMLAFLYQGLEGRQAISPFGVMV